jgi:hypothetical protein
VNARELEQLEREGIATVGGIAPHIAAPFQAGEHAEQLARLAVERARQLRLGHRHGLVGQVFDDVEALFQRRHGIFAAPLVARQDASNCPSSGASPTSGSGWPAACLSRGAHPCSVLPRLVWRSGGLRNPWRREVPSSPAAPHGIGARRAGGDDGGRGEWNWH